MFQPLRRFAEFRGRSTRTEYWQWMLFQAALFAILTAWAFADVDPQAAALGLNADAEPDAVPLGLLSLAGLAFVLPNLAVAARRLHDTDRSGWWLLLNLLPGIGSLVLFFFFVTDGSVGRNRYGEDPRGRVLRREGSRA